MLRTREWRGLRRQRACKNCRSEARATGLRVPAIEVARFAASRADTAASDNTCSCLPLRVASKRARGVRDRSAASAIADVVSCFLTIPLRRRFTTSLSSISRNSPIDWLLSLRYSQLRIPWRVALKPSKIAVNLFSITAYVEPVASGSALFGRSIDEPRSLCSFRQLRRFPKIPDPPISGSRDVPAAPATRRTVRRLDSIDSSRRYQPTARVASALPPVRK